MNSVFLFLFAGLIGAKANLQHAPPSFEVAGAPAVFVDFISAQYDIKLDVTKKTAIAVSTVVFESEAEGLPIFDLNANPTLLTLDGVVTTQNLLTPPGSQTKVRVLSSVAKIGRHTLVIEHDMMKASNELTPRFQNGGVKMAFLMNDLQKGGRGYLERYVPASFEYDQVDMTIHLEIVGLGQEQSIFTNGTVTQKRDNKWTVTFPSYFTSSSLFFHTGPKSAYNTLSYKYDSIDGRKINVTIYGLPSENLAKFKSGNESSTPGFGSLGLDYYLKYYESIYGPFPHSSMLVFANSGAGGGMEYSGATETDLNALAHELAHSYFARGVMPADGNSGWIDEAMATWVSGNPETPTGALPNTGSKMGNNGLYYRETNMLGYSLGAQLLGSEIEAIIQSQNPQQNFNTFLREWILNFGHKVITNQTLQSSLETYCGQSLSALFDRHVYGKTGKPGPVEVETESIHTDGAQFPY